MLTEIRMWKWGPLNEETVDLLLTSYSLQTKNHNYKFITNGFLIHILVAPLSADAGPPALHEMLDSNV